MKIKSYSCIRPNSQKIEINQFNEHHVSECQNYGVEAEFIAGEGISNQGALWLVNSWNRQNPAKYWL